MKVFRGGVRLLSEESNRPFDGVDPNNDVVPNYKVKSETLLSTS